MPVQTLTVAAVCFRDANSRVLTVRKVNTTAFMLPGGKLEPGEDPEHAALREVHEEIGVCLSLTDLTPLGAFEAAAANELDTLVIATVFSAPLDRAPVAAAEIAELRWVDPRDAPDTLAPLLRDHVFPQLTD